LADAPFWHQQGPNPLQLGEHLWRRPGYLDSLGRTGNESESTMPEEQLLQGSCHCGAVRLTLPSAPEKATKCNCSICRRLGGLWAYYEFGTVRIEGHPENTAEYIWGDKTLRNVRCKTCGCVTHWEPLAPEPGAKHGVNLNNFDPRLQESVQVRHFDGADTWTFID
jgi:hypothetical protein